MQRYLYISLSFFLVCFFCFGSSEAVETKKRADLVEEAAQYMTGMMPEWGAGSKSEQGSLLQFAAKIMAEEKQCAEALALYKQSLRYGVVFNSDSWLTMASAAACDTNWREASLAAYLAYQAAEDSEVKIRSLYQLGHFLVQRTEYYADWNPVAKAIYEQLLELEESDEVREKIAALEKKKSTLLLRNWFARTDGKNPSLCLQFSDWFPRDSDINYEDYIRISPEIKADFKSDGREICVAGAEYGTEYLLTVRQGLATRDKVVEESSQVTIKTGHRTPTAWFEQNSYVLPKYSTSGIAFHSINSDTIDFELFHIHERNIPSDFVHSNFRSRLSLYDLERIRDTIGESVWKGSTEIEIKRDKHQTSSLVLPETVVAAPGLYVLVAEDGNKETQKWSGRISQWLVVTDIGLTTYHGDDGLTVVARSLASARPLAGIAVTLLARNNRPLSRKLTDAQGVAHFASGLLQGKGGREPVLLVAENTESGFAFLQLDRPSFDLSDRGVSGRTVPGPVDAYVYTDRDLYRPGETVNMVALVRDQLGRAIDGPPMTLRLIAPDGRPALERVLQRDESGSYTTALSLAQSSRTGSWTVALYLDVEQQPVGSTSIRVEAFVPPRLSVNAASEDTLGPQSPARVMVQADYLYGSPGSGLKVEGDMHLVHDPHPISEFKDFTFGIEGLQVNVPGVELEPAITDTKGSGQLSCFLPEKLSESQPLKAVVRARVFDVDGRSVGSTTTLRVRHLNHYVGIKKLFSGGRARADSDVGFEVIVASGDGEVISGGNVRYRFFAEDVDYQWFRKNGDWGYQRFVTDRLMDEGQIGEVNPAVLSLHVSRGDYRLEILGGDSRLLASTRITAGDQIEGQSDTPDAIKVTLDKPEYQAGDTAHLQITSPYIGEGSLVIAGRGVYSLKNISFDNPSQSIDIPVESDWGAGAYAMVTVYRPGRDNPRGAGRAIGLVWLGIQPTTQMLGVNLQLPDRARPRQTIDIPVHIQGAGPGEEVSMTLAAVDEGVLGMTGFNSPDPLTYFFGKQQLGTEIRDFYGQLITGPQSRPLVLRSGGGDSSRRGAPKSNVRVVSLFSGIIRVGDDGAAVIPLALPDFNGQLRLMAVAWSRTKMGAVDHDLVVSDPVVVSPSLPRYLAMEDSSTMHVLLENIDGAEGEYTVQCTATGAVQIHGETEQLAVLQHGMRKGVTFDIGGQQIGSGRLHLQVRGPDGYGYDGDFELNVRGRYLPLLKRTFSRLAPGKALRIVPSMVAGLYRKTARVDVAISSSPNVDVVGLLKELDRYPYGCLEQVTSRAMPLLYANSLAQRWDYPLDEKVPGRIAGAIDLLLQKQRSDGSFGLWSNRSPAEPWLTAYAMDFLSRAVEAGFDVPDLFYDRGVSWLTDLVKEDSQPDRGEFEPLAYAHYVLARIQKSRPEDARYLFDNYLNRASSPMAIAQLSAALAMQGDRQRAESGFALAFEREHVVIKPWKSYGSRLRDLAGMISVVEDSAPELFDSAPLWASLTRLLDTRKYLSTQEKAWLVMAALTLAGDEPILLSVNGHETGNDTEFFGLQRRGDEIAAGTEIVNTGTIPLWVSTTVQGSPSEPLLPESKGFELDRNWYTTDGERIVIDQAHQQGDVIVVVLQGEIPISAEYRALLVDLLPAGFELSHSSGGGLQAPSLPWLSGLSDTLFVDGLDDRYVVAFNSDQLEVVGSGDETVRRFRIAYLLRAVIPGSYTLPPSEIEDMYQPQYRARTEASKATIIK